MTLKLSRTLRDKQKASGPVPSIGQYEESFRVAKEGNLENVDNANSAVSNIYFDLVTDFFEYGWGTAFFLAPGLPGESRKATLIRHERNLANLLNLKPGMVVADFGCGVGGPLLEIADFSGASIVGINCNEYQLKRARKLAEEAGLSHLASFMHCDFLHVDAPNESFDAIYSIGATCYATDKRSVYSEVFRLLKPGAHFLSYEWCMTNHFDERNDDHERVKGDIELGNGILHMDDYQTIDDALLSSGFEVLETEDIGAPPGPLIPWYQPLVGTGVSLASFRSSSAGRWLTHNAVKALENLRLAPRGTVEISDTLNRCALSLAEAGRLNIFTPMYLVHARKPELGPNGQ